MCDFRCAMCDVRFSMCDVRCAIFEVRCAIFDIRYSMSDVRYSIFDVRCAMSDVRCAMSGFRIASNLLTLQSSVFPFFTTHLLNLLYSLNCNLICFILTQIVPDGCKSLIVSYFCFSIRPSRFQFLSYILSPSILFSKFQFLS